MSPEIAILVFCACLVLSTAASAVLAERLDQVGRRFGFPAGLLGLVTALGGDAPEITSAVSALIGGQHDLGRGVIVGSNIFNVAALIGLSAVAAGRLRIGRPNLLLNAGVALWVTLAVGAQMLGWLGAAATGALLAAAMLPYLAISALRPSALAALPLPDGVTTWITASISAAHRGDARGEPERLSWADALSILPLLAVIVAASTALVRTAEILGGHWHVPGVVVGTFVVATLTGIPNLVAALRLALGARGAALSSEAFNSNTLNLLAGAYLPSLFVGFSPPSAEAVLSLGWLVGMTLAAAAIGLADQGFRRATGLLLLAGYAAYAVVSIR